jgi:quinol monooxygenase YgiN
MYGTVARMKPKPGQEKAIAALLDEWQKTRGNKVKGALAGYLYKPDKSPGEMLMVAVFQDKTTYTANAQDPEQDRWYQKLRAMLAADPLWEDGEIVAGGATR